MAETSDLTVKRYQSLDEAVADIFDTSVGIRGKMRIHGGDINDAFSLSLSNGETVFVKENSLKNIDFFVAEAFGLESIRNTGKIRVPKVLAIGTDKDRSFLLLSYIAEGNRSKDFFADFGAGLARMHMSDCSGNVSGGAFGYFRDNYIGAGYQENTPEESWIDFFRNRRLIPQIKRASAYFDPEDMSKLDRLLDRLDDLLAEPERPSLVHGDLWSGNFMSGPEGVAYLIDPAVYVGHAEVDLAMTELFGGFSRSFYEAYSEVYRLQPGYEDRKDLYNLYHMLNHLNLFGPSYLSSVRRIISRYSGV